MSFQLSSNQYGKSQVRLVKVIRPENPSNHGQQTFKELIEAVCSDQHTGAFLMYAHIYADKLLWVKEMKLEDDGDDDDDDDDDEEADNDGSEDESESD